MEDFENKIDSIASGVDKDENSWINKIYDKFNDNSENDEEVKNVEGLEPPMLDETWGLRDGDENRTKRSIEGEFQNEIEGNFFA